MARVLVIEDCQADLDLLTYLLEYCGHVVIQAHGGREGIGAARATRPDLILCDVGMPDLDGYEVLDRLHRTAELKDTPVLAVTGLTSVGDQRSMLGAGFRGHMPKPIEPATFLAEITRHLGPTEPAPH